MARKVRNPFLKHYKALNARHLAAKVGTRRRTARTKARWMRKIRRRNRPIMILALSLHRKLQKFAMKRGKKHCVLGMDARIVRDVWRLAETWHNQYR